METLEHTTPPKKKFVESQFNNPVRRDGNFFGLDDLELAFG